MFFAIALLVMASLINVCVAIKTALMSVAADKKVVLAESGLKLCVKPERERDDIVEISQVKAAVVRQLQRTSPRS